MKKKTYVQPDARVTALRVTNRLLAGSPLNAPNPYEQDTEDGSGFTFQ